MTWSFLASLLLAFAGLAALSLAMDRHLCQATGRADIARWLRASLRAAGAALLLFALICVLPAWGASVGAVVWLGAVSVAALSVALVLCFLPQAMVVALTAAAVLGVCAWGLPAMGCVGLFFRFACHRF